MVYRSMGQLLNLHFYNLIFFLHRIGCFGIRSFFMELNSVSYFFSFCISN